ncbi:hypothetical protein [Halegenticoccus tardaugens]|uniref:hypothetical protein n=1 Tax=Halegenticoccus tardaugens TaxID=2071624 RepID=UPI00100BA7EC|nr:hypothetical protein [Halegenticoccus tardaugens]
MSTLDATRELTRAEVAAYLRAFADRLDGTDGGPHGTGVPRATPSDAGGPESTAEPPDESGDGAPPVSDAADDAGASNAADETAIAVPEETSIAVAGEEERPHAAASNDDRPVSASTGKVTLLSGTDGATINPPEAVTFEVAVDATSSLLRASTRRRVTFSLSWDAADEPEDDELRVQ